MNDNDDVKELNNKDMVIEKIKKFFHIKNNKQYVKTWHILLKILLSL